MEKTQKKLVKKAAATPAAAGAPRASGSGAKDDGAFLPDFELPPRRSAEVAERHRLPQSLEQEVLDIRTHWVPLLPLDASVARLPFGVPSLKRYAGGEARPSGPVCVNV